MTGRYRLLEVEGLSAPRLALSEEVQPDATGHDASAFVLTDLGRRLGDRRLGWRVAPYAHGAVCALLERWIYRDHTLSALVAPALWTASAVLAVGLLLAVPTDRRRARDRRHGRRIKGPELVTVAQFNRRSAADGLTFAQPPLAFRRPTAVRLPRALESSHVLIVGDSGTGKSALIRQMPDPDRRSRRDRHRLRPGLEYTPQFYTPSRGERALRDSAATQGSADRVRVARGGERLASGRLLRATGHQPSHLLRLEEEVRARRCERSAALPQLEDENNRLKRLVAELALDQHVLVEALRRSSEAHTRSELAQWLRETYGVSCVRACHLAQVSRAAWYKKGRA